MRLWKAVLAVFLMGFWLPLSAAPHPGQPTGQEPDGAPSQKPDAAPDRPPDTQAPAAGAEDPLAGLIAGVHHPMTLSADGLSGPGAELLREAARASHFFLLGESHGNVETPALAAALAEEIRPFGYSVLAVEVGPLTAERMDRLLEEPDPMAAFQRFHEAWPFTIPFFFWQEEVAMLQKAHELGFEVWGLDQEFIASARYLLSELEPRVEDEGHRARVRAWREQAARGFEHFQASGDSSQGFLNAIDPEDLAAFAAELPEGAAEARRIVEEIRQSAIIYQHFHHERYYLNNSDRIRLMKRHLAEYVRAAGGLEATPRVLFKLGSVHMGRGYSPLHQLDLGNAAAELAAARFSDSFHLYVVTARSVSLDGEESDWTEESPDLALFAEHLEDGKWGVFDLRGLRRHFAAEANREAHPELAEIVFRYDAAALAPVFHAAHPMIELPF